MMGSSASKGTVLAPTPVRRKSSQKESPLITKSEPVTMEPTREDTFMQLIEGQIAELSKSSCPWNEAEILNNIQEGFFAEEQKYVIGIGDLLVKHKFLDVAVAIWDHGHMTDDENEHYCNSDAYNLMKIILWNYSDKCVNFCKAAYTQEKAVERNMREFSDPITSVKNTEDDTIRYFIKSAMGFLHNILRLYNANRVLVRRNNGIQKILKYKESSYLIIKAKAMLILAYCIDEEENEKIMTGSGVIVFIMQLLTSALDSPNHIAETYLFSALETVMGLNKLASNDDNKLKIVDAEILPLLHKMLGHDFSTAEKSVALECLWTLSFKEQNKEPIKKIKGLLDRVHRLANDPESDGSITRPCDGILFNIEEKPTVRHKETTEKADSAGHIMISYQWDVQDTILELRTKLEESGHKVWLDVDKLEGSILSAMAEAVENASVVVVAMTDRYKHSNPCRTEAEYAYKLSKPIVPLLLEPGYKPKGWLGALLGMHLYFDITVENWQETKFGKLLKNINSKLGSEHAIANESITVADAPVLGSAPSRQAAVPVGKLSCRKWGTEEVAKWAKTSGIDNLASYLSSFDGAALEGLHKMLKRSPDFYYACVKAEMKLNLLQMLRFTNALEDL